MRTTPREPGARLSGAAASHNGMRTTVHPSRAPARPLLVRAIARADDDAVCELFETPAGDVVEV